VCITDFPAGITDFAMCNTDFPAGITDFAMCNTDFAAGITDFEACNTDFEVCVTDSAVSVMLTAESMMPRPVHVTVFGSAVLLAAAAGSEPRTAVAHRCDEPLVEVADDVDHHVGRP
jgi:hypothetical protein